MTDLIQPPHYWEWLDIICEEFWLSGVEKKKVEHFGDLMFSAGRNEALKQVISLVHSKLENIPDTNEFAQIGGALEEIIQILEQLRISRETI